MAEMTTYGDFYNSNISFLQKKYGFNKKQADLIFDMAWQSHDCGMDDVVLLIRDYADLVTKVINATNENAN